VPQLRSVGGSTNVVYEDYERLIDKTNGWLRHQPDVNLVNLQSILDYKRLIDKTNGWLRHQPDVNLVNLQSILVQKDSTGALNMRDFVLNF